MAASFFPRWRVVQPAEGAEVAVIAPDERLPWGQTTVMGVQHVIAMFGANVLAPILMGFDPNVAILMSGVGTLIFFLITGGRVPSYLGSSFAFIGVVIAATAYAGKGPNANIGVALGGIVACGVIYTLIGAIVQAIAAGIGRGPDVLIGKPSPLMVNRALQRAGLSPERCLMVGDTVDIDVRMGQAAGMATALVLTGVDSKETIATYDIRPTYVLDSIADIVDHLPV